MTLLEKFRRHPYSTTTAGRSFLRALVQFCQEPTSRIFSRFQFSPVLSSLSIHAHTRTWSGEHDVQRIQAPGARNHE